MCIHVHIHIYAYKDKALVRIEHLVYGRLLCLCLGPCQCLCLCLRRFQPRGRERDMAAAGGSRIHVESFCTRTQCAQATGQNARRLPTKVGVCTCGVRSRPMPQRGAATRATTESTFHTKILLSCLRSSFGKGLTCLRCLKWASHFA